MLAGATALAFSSQAFAEETGGCQSFAWSVATELKWMQADSQAANSGAKLAAPPEKAIKLSLEPMAAVSFPVAPTGRKKPEGEVYGGVI